MRTKNPKHRLQNKTDVANIVVVAGSVGAIEVLCSLLQTLPADLDAAIVIVQHVSRLLPSHLAEILARQTPMKVRQATDGDTLCRSCIFVAPPNQHLLVESGGVLRLSRSPPIHHCRPSAEPLFCSAAAVFGKQVLGVVLTGSDSDASLGVQVVKNAGGQIIVQNQETSADFSMPSAAIETGAVDLVLPLNKIAPAIVVWSKKSHGKRPFKFKQKHFPQE